MKSSKYTHSQLTHYPLITTTENTLLLIHCKHENSCRLTQAQQGDNALLVCSLHDANRHFQGRSHQGRRGRPGGLGRPGGAVFFFFNILLYNFAASHWPCAAGTSYFTRVWFLTPTCDIVVVCPEHRFIQGLPVGDARRDTLTHGRTDARTHTRTRTKT